MKNFILLLLIVLTSVFAHAQKKPNIIVFLVDDMGWMDTSVPFGENVGERNKRFYTPNMERLANEGMKFTNAYATPVCTPSRISMITGMNAAHHGVTNWTSPRKDVTSDNDDEQMAPAPWMINGLSPVAGIPKTVYATTYPQLLKEAGYLTIHIGKAHWASAGTPGVSPYNLGFVVNVSGHAAGSPQSYYGGDNYGNIPGKASLQAVPDLEEYYGSDTFLTEALTLEAIKAIDGPIKNKQPFYLNMAHYAVHDPLQGDPRFFKKYLNAGLDTIEARYASMIEGMDKSLGDIMDYLEETNTAKNTIIMFMSDNGGLSLTPPRGGQQHTHNLPLKAGKGSVFEGGIREPMLVKWSGTIQPGSIAHQYVIIEDFFPTILDLAGIKNVETIQEVDGRSFLPILKNSHLKDTTRSLIWHIPNKWIKTDGPGINYKSAIRKGNWKLIYDMRTGKRQLYNLKNDIAETIDLASVHPEIVKMLATELSSKLRKWKSPMPVLKNTGKAVAMPDEV